MNSGLLDYDYKVEAFFAGSYLTPTVAAPSFTLLLFIGCLGILLTTQLYCSGSLSLLS